MFDLASFIDKCSYEAEFDTPTDSVRTQIAVEGDEVKLRKLYDVEEVLKRAEFFRQINRENNGFSEHKHFRHIGCIPQHAMIDIMQKSEGDNQEMSKLIKRYLREHPGFCTVDSVRSI